MQLFNLQEEKMQSASHHNKKLSAVAEIPCDCCVGHFWPNI